MDMKASRLIQDLESQVTGLDPAIARQVQAQLDDKTKPRGSLGQLEELAVQYALVGGSANPERPNPAIVVMAGDHGVTAEGVSAYPSEVTGQMVANFASGGAAINVLTRRNNTRLVVVDIGVQSPIPDLPGVRVERVRNGTRNFLDEPAMTETDMIRAIGIGSDLASELCADGINAIGLGEMGIGNTTAASAITAALLDQPAEAVCGRGTGIDDASLQRKIDVVNRARAIHELDGANGLRVLQCVGGFELAGLVGVILGAARSRCVVVVDGFITAAAALVAVNVAPAVRPYLVAAHQSVEIGHTAILDNLGLRPLLDLELRLGEGSGAALALDLLDAAWCILIEMASFSDAGVTDTGR